MDSRIKNGIRNIFAGFINKIVLIFLPFVTRTVIVYVLGSEYLGLGSLFSSILMVLNLSELGIGSALVYSMYKPVAENDMLKIKALLAVYKKIYAYIGVAILAIGLCFLPFIHTIIKGDVPASMNLYILYIMYLSNASISYFIFAHKKALLIAYQRSDVISNVNTVLNICVYTVQIMVLLLLKDYYIYVAVFIFSTITENIIIGKKAQIHFPYIEADGRISAEDKKVIIQHTKGIALQKVCSTSRNSLDSIVISMFLGLNMIAIYSNYYYIMISIHNILYQIPDSIRATVGNSVASESVDKNFRDFNCMYLLNMFICGWATCFLYCMFQPFMELWMGPNMMFSQVSVVLVCLYFTLLSLADVVALYKDAAGLWWYGRYRVLIEAIANLILNFVLGYFWGVNGILLATIITIILIGHGYGGWIVFHYYFKGKSFMTFVMKQVGYLVMIAVACYVTDFVCSFSLEILWIRLLSVGIITLFLSPILLLIMYRFFPEFKDSVDFAKNILKSFKR